MYCILQLKPSVYLLSIVSLLSVIVSHFILNAFNSYSLNYASTPTTNKPQSFQWQISSKLQLQNGETLSTPTSGESPSKSWEINWNFFISRFIDKVNLSAPSLQTPNISTSHMIDTILPIAANTIHWSDLNYVGFCKPFLYPYVAFININNSFESQLFHKAGITVSTNPTTNGNTINQLQQHNSTTAQIQSLVAGAMHNDYSLFDTSIVYPNLTRVDLFEQNPTNWRFSSLVVLADPIGVDLLGSLSQTVVAFAKKKSNKNKKKKHDVQKQKEKLQQQLGSIETFKLKTMIIEIVVSRNVKLKESNDNTHDPSSLISDPDNRFLCVFSDGTTVISTQFPKVTSNLGFVIQCDITDKLLLKYSLYQQTYDQTASDTSGSSASTSINDRILTNIGVSVFSLHPKHNTSSLINEYIVSMNVKLPVCGAMEVNRAPKIWESESDYLYNLDNPQFDMYSTILFIDKEKNKPNKNKNENIHSKYIPFTDFYDPQRVAETSSNTKNEKLKLNFKYFLSVVNTIHPRSRSGQMDILLLQWLDYHIFQGFDHFYLYDHLYNRDETDISYFYDILFENYIQTGYVTLIQWSMIARRGEHVWYQFSAFLDSIRRFAHETQFLWLGDIDELIIPKPNRTRDIMPQSLQKNWDKNNMNINVDHASSNLNQNDNILSENEPILATDTKKTGSDITDDTDDTDTDTTTEDNDKQMQDRDFLNDNHVIQDRSISSSVGSLKDDQTPTSNNHQSRGLQNNIEFETAETKLGSLKQQQQQLEQQRRRLRFDYYFTRMLYPDIKENEMIRVRDIINATLNGNNPKYNGIEILNYPGLQDIYNLWHNPSDSDIKQLGCDSSNEANRFDTYFERHSCLHYQTRTIADIMDNTPVNWAKDRRARIMYKILRGKGNNGDMYEVRPKLLINPRTVLFGIHHFVSVSRYNYSTILKSHNEPKKYANENITYLHMNEMKYKYQYDMFILHLRDHWNHLEKRNDFINFKSVGDMKLFYSVTSNKCDFENIIMYWNNKFLNSIYGQKWKNTLMINPLVDENGVFCYLKNQNYTFQWTNEINVVTNKRYTRVSKHGGSINSNMTQSKSLSERVKESIKRDNQNQNLAMKRGVVNFQHPSNRVSMAQRKQRLEKSLQQKKNNNQN